MSPPRALTPEDACRLLVAAGVLTDRGQLWSVADVTRWMLAAGLRRGGLLVVTVEAFHGAFPEVRCALDGPDEAPSRPRKLPAVLTIRDVANLMGEGWSTERARDWLLKVGALEKRGGRWITTPERLSAVFPEVYQRIVDEITERDDSFAA